MATRKAVTFHGGAKDGVTCKVLTTAGGLPKVLVFQGIIDDRFQVLHYHLMEGTTKYEFDDRRSTRDTVRRVLEGTQ